METQNRCGGLRSATPQNIFKPWSVEKDTETNMCAFERILLHSSESNRRNDEIYILRYSLDIAIFKIYTVEKNVMFRPFWWACGYAEEGPSSLSKWSRRTCTKRSRYTKQLNTLSISHVDEITRATEHHIVEIGRRPHGYYLRQSCANIWTKMKAIKNISNLLNTLMTQCPTSRTLTRI